MKQIITLLFASLLAPIAIAGSDPPNGTFNIDINVDPRVAGFAEHCLADYASGDFDHLVSDTRPNMDFEARLFASYLLYKRHPSTYRGTFISAFPANRDQYEAYISIDSSLPYDPEAQNYMVKNSAVPWAIGFWEIYQEIYDLAVAGEPTSIKAVIDLMGFGDGYLPVWLAAEVAELFYIPELVAAHWGLFEPHVEMLGAWTQDSPGSEVAILRAKYAQAFENDPEALRTIQYQLECGER